MVTRKTVVNIDLPKLRYVDDAARVLNSIQAELKDTTQLIKMEVKKLAYLNDKLAVTKIKGSISSDLVKLNALHLLSEDLNAKVRTLDAMATQLTMQFSTQNKTTSYLKVVSSMHELKVKAKLQLSEALDFIGLVAKSKMPRSFAVNSKLILATVQSEITSKSQTVNAYCSNIDGQDLFSYYLHLKSAVNSVGEVVPNLYISLHYNKSTDTISSNLDQEFELSNSLVLSNPVIASNKSLILSNVYSLLSNEQFNTALNVKLSESPALFNDYTNYLESIKSVTVNSKSIVFNISSKAKLTSHVVNNIYKDLLTLTRSTGHKLLVNSDTQAVAFTFQRSDTSSPINSYDLEFLSDKFNLSSSKVQKMVNLFL